MEPYSTAMSEVKIEESWKAVIGVEFEKPYFQAIRSFLKKELAAGKAIYPPGPLIFNAFDHTPFDRVKVVLLGQDPYIKPGEAMGLCFSVPKGMPIPPSLKNIFSEIEADIGCPMTQRKHGDLTCWASQGVFLLNASLTVERGKSNAHAAIGWHTFTDVAIRTLSEQREGLVFLLWGSFAKQKAQLVDPFRHLILEAAHPSPLARNAFSGCRHFSKTNEFLLANNQRPIDWCCG